MSTQTPHRTTRPRNGHRGSHRRETPLLRRRGATLTWFVQRHPLIVIATLLATAIALTLLLPTGHTSPETVETTMSVTCTGPADVTITSNGTITVTGAETSTGHGHVTVQGPNPVTVGWSTPSDLCTP